MKKIVMRIKVKGDCCRSKALKLASSMNGVESVGIRGKDRNYLVVTGDGVDPVGLARALRKKMGYAEIIGVGKTSDGLVEEHEEPTYESAAASRAVRNEIGGIQNSHNSSAIADAYPPSYPCIAYYSTCNYPVQCREVCYSSAHGVDGCSIM